MTGPGSVASTPPSERVQLWMKQQDRHYLLAQLDSKHNVHVQLNLNLSLGEEITYYLNGTGVVHLTGYILALDTGFDLDLNDTDDDDEV